MNSSYGTIGMPVQNIDHGCYISNMLTTSDSRKKYLDDRMLLIYGQKAFERDSFLEKYSGQPVKKNEKCQVDFHLQMQGGTEKRKKYHSNWSSKWDFCKTKNVK